LLCGGQFQQRIGDEREVSSGTQWAARDATTDRTRLPISAAISPRAPKVRRLTREQIADKEPGKATQFGGSCPEHNRQAEVSIRQSYQERLETSRRGLLLVAMPGAAGRP
jgi:hypothetical protein